MGKLLLCQVIRCLPGEGMKNGKKVSVDAVRVYGLLDDSFKENQ